MKLTAIGRTMGDETTPYKVTEYQAKTVAEFVNEVLKEEPKEWGYFEVKHETRGFLFCPRIEYSYGKLLNEIPEAWQHQEIEKIEACGGWSRMDYYITTKKYNEQPMEQEKTTNETQPEKKPFDFITEERLHEILNILLPWGYSKQKNKYTGLSPYIGETTNIISIIANDTVFEIPFSICMESFDPDGNENNSLGFYKGIMKLIAPELHSYDEAFKGNDNVLDFDWAPDCVQVNKFPANVTYYGKIDIL
ncbi:MAG: hypothetical protein IKM68_00350 [Bacteroidaceae bacterium]|nr:hypothetical protein [Bacteroidaceae bacterium]